MFLNAFVFSENNLSLFYNVCTIEHIYITCGKYTYKKKNTRVKYFGLFKQIWLRACVGNGH